MEEQEIKKEKTLLEKIAPFVLIVLIIVVAYFGLSKLNLGGGGLVITNSPASQSTVSLNVDIDFLNSSKFTSLKFVPDSPVFNAATGIIPSGREDPFAPVN